MRVITRRICKEKSNQLSLKVGLLAVIMFISSSIFSQNSFFAGDGSAFSASKWAATNAGPFTSAFTAGNVANFAIVNGTGTGASITIGGITATENFTLTGIGGTISNLSNGVVIVDVAAGKTVDFSTQTFTTSGSAGYTKNGTGVFALGGGTYGGGFTINAGTLIARGVNAMGGNATPGGLTINGGVIAGSGTRDFSGKYSGITIGGDFTLGATTGLASSAANLTFSNNVSLGAATTRAITIGGTGNYTFGGIISGVGSNLIVNNTAAGTLIFTNANTYSGLTTLSGGTLQLNRTGGTTLPITNNVSVNGGTLQISSNQTLNDLTLANGAVLIVDNGITLTINGTFNHNGGSITLTGTGIIAYGASGTLSYGGSSGAQIANVKEFPVTNGPKNLTINNASGVSLPAAFARTIAGDLALTSGTFADGGNILTVGGNISGSGSHSGAGKISMTGTSKSISAATLGNLELNGSTFSLTGSPIINGTLTFTGGKITLGTNNITTAAISGGSSSTYAVSDNSGTLTIKSIGASPILFPVGPSSSIYSPISISNGGTTDFSVKVQNSFTNAVQISSKVVNLQWTISKTGAQTLNSVTLTPQWNSTDEAGSFIRTNNLVLGHYGSSWDEITAGSVSGPVSGLYSTTITGVPSFSPFGIGNRGAFSSTAPTVTTDATPSVITTTGATFGGNVTNDGGSDLTSKGVVWAVTTTNATPAIAGSGVTNVAHGNTSTGTFSVSGTGMPVNTQISYRAYAINPVNTSYGGGSGTTFYTLANTPGTPTVNNPNTTTLDVLLNANSNPASTQFAIHETTTNKYVQSANGSLNTTADWQNAATWGTKTVTGLAINVNYIFEVKARNGAATPVETAFGTSASLYTLATLPGAPTVNGATATSLNVTISTNGNPAANEPGTPTPLTAVTTTQYAIFETTTNQYVQANGSLGAGAIWQTSSTWGTKTVTGLSPNTQYTFEVKARNGNNVETAFSGTSSAYTLANTPGTPTVNGATITSLNVLLNANSNPSTTEFAIHESVTNKYVQADGSLNTSAVWQTATNWGTKTVTGLLVNSLYTFEVKARNAVPTETGFGSSANGTTLANVPGTPTVNNPTHTTLSVTVSANGNPAATQFAIQETSTTNYVQADGSLNTTAVWQTASTWGTQTVTGLTPNTTYTFKVKARNGASIETAFGSTASGTTTALVPGLWTGAQSTNWNTPGNWDDLTVPTAATDVTIPASPTSQPGLTTTTTIHNLTINGSSILSLNDKLLNIQGSVSGAGFIKGSAASQLYLGAALLHGYLLFDQTTPGTTNLLNSFSMDGDVSVGNALVIDGTMEIEAGILYNSNNVTVREGSTVYRENGDVIAPMAYGSGNGVDIQFTGSTDVTESKLLTPASGTVGSVTIILSDASKMVTTPTALSISAEGDVNIYSGTLKLGNDLFLDGNWDNSATFNPNGKTVTFNCLTTQQFYQSGMGDFYNLTLNNVAGLHLHDILTVNNILQLDNGNIITGLYKVTIGANGIVSGSGGYVDGNLEKLISVVLPPAPNGNSPHTAAIVKTFEVGSGPKYSPVSLSLYGVVGSGSLLVSTYDGEHSDISNSGIDQFNDVTRYWNITQTGFTLTNYDVTFDYPAGDVDVIANAGTFIVRKYNATWSSPPGGVTYNSPTSITGLGFTSFSDFAIGAPAGPACTPPPIYNVTGGGSYCAGGLGVPVGMDYSELGTNYQLLLNGSNTGSPVSGSNSTLTFGNQTASGTYTVIATNGAGCTATMSGSAVVTVNPLPQVFSVTGGGNGCPGLGPDVGLSGSESGVDYQLSNNGSDVGSAVPGTGSALNFGPQNFAGTYSVVATNPTTTCTSNMSGSANVAIYAGPDQFNVTGGGTYCSGGTPPSVGLDDTDGAVSYQLQKDGSNIGSPVIGTGSAITFGPQAAAGTYSVIATDPQTCVATMNGVVTVTVNICLPAVTTTAATGITTNSASSGGDVTSDGGSPVTARGVYYGTSPSPGSGTSNGSGLGTFVSSLTPLAVNTQYYYRAYATNAGGTTFGAELNFYTLANVPSAPTVNNPGSTSLDVTINPNGNPGSTEFAIQMNNGQFVQANGSLGASPAWYLVSTKTVTGLAPLTTYGFHVQARNGALVPTAFGATASGTTLSSAPNIIANMGDHLTNDPPTNGDGQANPGETLKYQDTIKNVGNVDGLNVYANHQVPQGTTLVPGSLKTSALARDDSYPNLTVNGNVLTNDYGLPTLTVVSYGVSTSTGATCGAGTTCTTDNGGSVNIQPDGNFVYSPPVAFTGYDKFKYIAHAGAGLPDNDAIVTIQVGASPLANGDTYTDVIGNVAIHPSGSYNLLANDAGSGDVVTTVTGSGGPVGANVTTTTVQGGDVRVQANGDFIFNPKAGFEGTDAFTYTINNGFNQPSVGTVTLTVTGMLWYIQNGGAAGDGRLTNPFNSIPAFGANDDPNDNIFLYESGSAYAGHFILLSGQRLIGQDASSSLSSITGLTPNINYSLPFPIMNTGAPAVTIDGASDIITLGVGNTIRGMTLRDAGIDKKLKGSAFGTLTLGNNTTPDVIMSGTGQAMDLTNGSFGNASGLISVAATSSAGNGITLNTIAGNIDMGSTNLSALTAQGISVIGSTATITFGTTTIVAGSDGVVLQNNNSGTRTFGTLNITTGGNGVGFLNSVDGGTTNTGATTITSPSGTGVGIQITGASHHCGFGATTVSKTGAATGVLLGGAGALGNSAGQSFSSLGITTSNGAGLVGINNTGSISVTSPTSPINATNGAAIDFSSPTTGGTNVNLKFSGLTTTGTGVNAVSLSKVSGSVVGGTGSLVGSGAVVSINAGGVSFFYNGNVTQANNAALVSVTGGHQNGVVTFNTGTLDATNGTGLQFDDADASYNFSGTTNLHGGDAGIDILNGSAGTFTFGSGTAITNPTNELIKIDASTADVTYSGSFQKNTTGGTCIKINNETGGTIDISGSSATKILQPLAGGKAIELTTNTGATIKLGGSNITMLTDGATAFTATGGGTVEVTGTGTGHTIVANTGATGLDIQNTNASASGITFASIASTSGTIANIISSTNTKTLGRVSSGSGGTSGLNLSSAGTVNVGSASLVSSINKGAGDGITINNTTLNITGTAANNLAISTTAGGHGVNVTGGTVNITGGNMNINISAGAGVGFRAVSGGTVQVTGANNTISSGSGGGINVTSTTIGASGLTFQSISSNGATHGITLNTTGTGFFTVTGNSSGNGGGTITINPVGTAATFTAPVLADLTGGTIQNSTSSGISLMNVGGAVSFTRIYVLNSGTHGIEAGIRQVLVGTPGVAGFTLDHSFITDNAGVFSDNGVFLNNCSGTISISNSTIGPSPHNGIVVDNYSVNLSSFSLTNSVVRNTDIAPGIGGDGILFEMRGNTVVTKGLIDGCVFKQLQTTGAQILTDDQARTGLASGGIITTPVLNNSFTIQNSTFANNNAGIDMSQSQISNEVFQILNCTFQGHHAQPINVFSAAGGAGSGTGPTIHYHVGNIDGNVIGRQGTKDDGSEIGAGIRAVIQGDATQGYVRINNNTIYEVPNSGNGIISIYGQNGNAAIGSGTALAQFKITNNTLPAPSGTNQSIGCGAGVPCLDDGIFILADEAFPVCAVVTGNNIFDVKAFPGGNADIYLAERSGPPVGAQLTINGSGSATTYIAANNTLAGASKVIDEGANVSTGTCNSTIVVFNQSLLKETIDYAWESSALNEKNFSKKH